jgi:hypothetical protein
MVVGEAGALELIIVVNDCIIEKRKSLDPSCATLLLGIEVGIAWDLVLGKEMSMSLCVLRQIRTILFGRHKLHVAMGRDRCNGKEPRLRVLRCLLEKAIRLLCSHIRRVLTLVAYGWSTVTTHVRVVVFVRIGVEDEVGTVVSAGVGCVVIVNRVVVPQLARVVRVVASILHPYWEVVIVDAFANDLWVAT